MPAKLKIVIGKGCEEQHCMKVFLKIEASGVHVLEEQSNFCHIFSCCPHPDVSVSELMEFKEMTGKSSGSKEKIEDIICPLCNGRVGYLVFPVEIDVLLKVVTGNGAKESADLAIQL